MHLDGVVLPLGPRGIVSLERATAAVGGAARRAAGLPEARLHAFRGVARFGATGEPSFVADVVFHAEPRADERAWIAGDLVIERATWTPAPGAVEARAMRGRAKLFVTSSEWRLDDGVLESERARVRFSGSGALDSSARGGGVALATLALDEAKVGPFLDAASAIAGRTLAAPPGVPVDAGITGELSWSAETGGRGELAVDAEGIEIRARGSVGRDGRDLDATVDARARPAIALRGAKVSPKLLPREEDELVLDLRVTGDASRPSVKGAVRASELVFRLGRPRFAPPAAVFRELACELAAEGDQALARATARAGEGLLTLHLDVPVRDVQHARAHAWIKDLDAGWVAALLSGAGTRVSLPRDARATLELVVTRETAEGEASIVTPRSRIAVAPIRVRGRAIEGTRVSGDLAIEDALTLGLRELSVRPTAEGALTMELDVSGTPSAPRVAGTLAAPRLALLVAARDGAPPLDVRDARARVEMTREAVVFSEVALSAYDAEATGDAVVPLAGGGRSRASLRGAGGPLFAAACARFVPREIAFPDDTRLSFDLAAGGDASVDLRTTLSTGAARGTSLSARFVLGRDGRVDGSSIAGHVGLVDLPLAVPAAGPLLAPPEGAVLVDADVYGEARAMELAGVVAADLARLGPVVVSGASALVHAAGSTVVWHDLEAHAFGGGLASAGIVTAFPSGVELAAKIAARALAVEALPVGEPGSLGRFVTGRLEGAIRIDRKDGALSGKGSLVLGDAEFPVLERARGELGRYGLPPPPTRANAPATVDIALSDAGLSLQRLRASVAGCAAAGEVTVGADGALAGALTVTLDEEYLSSSAVLVLPAVLAERLTVPVKIGGTAREPTIDADLASCFGRFVTDNRVSAFVSDAAQEVASLFGSRPPPRLSADPPPEPVGAGDDEDLVRALEARRAAWARVEGRLAEHRRRVARVRVGG